MSRVRIPLFPLNTVLFPGGVLPLRIFEPRYLDMISQCLKTERGIGVVLICEGHETGQAADTYEMGTLSRISYWHRRPDGLLGITLAGQQRFRILSREVQPNQLIEAEVELLAAEVATPLAPEHARLVDLLKQIISQLEPPYANLTPHYEDANWVSARLSELLPIDLTDKQRLLLDENPHQRLAHIAELLRRRDLL